MFHKRAAERTGGGDGETSVVWVGDDVAEGCDNTTCQFEVLLMCFQLCN